MDMHGTGQDGFFNDLLHVMLVSLGNLCLGVDMHGTGQDGFFNGPLHVTLVYSSLKTCALIYMCGHAWYWTRWG